MLSSLIYIPFCPTSSRACFQTNGYNPMQYGGNTRVRIYLCPMSRSLSFAEPQHLWNLLLYLYGIFLLPPQWYSFSTLFLYFSSLQHSIQRVRMQMRFALLFSAYNSPYMEWAREWIYYAAAFCSQLQKLQHIKMVFVPSNAWIYIEGLE
jgi:hypothetical protein